MKFEQFIEKAQTGDVLLFRGKSRFSRLIEAHTRSPYSHAAGLVWEQHQGAAQLMVVEAYEDSQSNTVTCRSVEEVLCERYPRHESVDWYRTLNSWQVSKRCASAFWTEKIGQRYAGWWQFAWSFGHVISKFREWTGARACVNDHRWFCSHLIAAGLFDCGYHPNSEDPHEPALVTPEALSRFTCLRNMGPIEF